MAGLTPAQAPTEEEVSRPGESRNIKTELDEALESDAAQPQPKSETFPGLADSASIKQPETPRDPRQVSQQPDPTGVRTLFEKVIMGQATHLSFWKFQFLVAHHEGSRPGTEQRFALQCLPGGPPVVEPC